MNAVKISLVSFLVLFSQQAFCLSPNTYRFHAPYIDLGVGWAFNIKDRNVQVVFPTNLPDSYLSGTNKDNVFLALSGGYAWFFDKAWLPAASLGIEYSAIPKTSNTGQIEQFSDPELINYSYSYRVSRQQLSLLAKLDIYRADQFMPFIMAGIGNSWSRFSNYKEAPLPGVNFPRTNPNYLNKTKSDISYTLGLGLDYQPLKNLLFSLAYRYDNFGKFNSGSNTLGLSNAALTGKAHSDTAILNVRYLFA